MDHDSTTLQTVKAQVKKTYKNHPGVTGVGIGDNRVRVYVTNAAVGATLPAQVNGVAVEVVETQEIVALPVAAMAADD